MRIIRPPAKRGSRAPHPVVKKQKAPVPQNPPKFTPKGHEPMDSRLDRIEGTVMKMQALMGGAGMLAKVQPEGHCGIDGAPGEVVSRTDFSSKAYINYKDKHGHTWIEEGVPTPSG